MPELTIVPAGAGAGKTYRIETQLSEWRRSGVVRPERILAVTFTEAAASELRQRIRARLLAEGMMADALSIDRAYISTIHGLGLRILKEHAFANGSSPTPRLLSDDERKLLIRHEIARSDALKPIAAHIDRFGYRGHPYNRTSAEDAFRDKVRETVDLLSTLGARGLDPDLAADAVDVIRATYGQVSANPSALTDRLREAVRALVTEFPEGTEAVATSDKARNDFRVDLQALRRALTRDVLDWDWALWNRLRLLRCSKRGSPTPEGYDALAQEVMSAAHEIQSHPGPLEDACRHATALIGGARSILASYAERKRIMGVVDFTDMVSDAERLLRSDADVRGAILSEIDCVIVDEFQDTNPIQFALIWRLAREAPRTMLVGDIKQAIMGFQGADARLTEALIAAHPDRVAPLDKNWRSDPRIMDFVNALGPRLFAEGYQTLAPTRQAGTLSALTVLSVTSGPLARRPNSRPYQHVAAYVLDLLDDTKARILDRHTGRTRRPEPGDIAVLCRTNNQCNRYAEALRVLGLPVRVSATGWWSSPVVQAARFALTVAADPADRHATLCFATLGPPRRPLEDCLVELINGRETEPEEIAALRGLWPASLGKPVTTLVSEVIATAALRQWVERHDDPEQARADLLRFQAEAAVFLDTHRDTRVAAGFHGNGAQVFLGWLAARADDRDFDERPDPSGGTADGIEVVTWHSAKGREWPVVVVACLGASHAPRTGTLQTQFDDFGDLDAILDTASLRFIPPFETPEVADRFLEGLKPEADKTARRLLYVALTRARDALIIEWPEFHLSKKRREDESVPMTMAHLLATRCGLRLEAAALALGDDLFPARIIPCPKEMPPAFEAQAATSPSIPRVPFGRAAIREAPPADPGPPWLIQPSLLTDVTEQPPATIQTIPLGSGLDGLAGVFSSPAHRGAALHEAFRVLMLRPDLAGRVSEVVGLDDAAIRHIIDQAQALRAFLADRGFPEIALEVPVMAQDAHGSTISAVIDCIAHGDEGFAIVDHKSDAVPEPETQVTKYWPQLSAYRRAVEILRPEEQVQLMAIHWLACGSISIIVNRHPDSS